MPDHKYVNPLLSGSLAGKDHARAEQEARCKRDNKDDALDPPHDGIHLS